MFCDWQECVRLLDLADTNTLNAKKLKSEQQEQFEEEEKSKLELSKNTDVLSVIGDIKDLKPG